MTHATDRRQQRTYDLDEIVRKVDEYLRHEEGVEQAAELTLFISRNARGEFTDLVAQGRRERLV